MPEFPCVAGGYAFGSTVNTATSLPTSCATTATGGVKGSWVELHAATPFAAGEVIIECGANTGDWYSVDIGIGGAGSEVVLIPNLSFQNRTASDRGDSYRFRVAIPAGSRISARACDTTGLSATVYVKIIFITPTALNSQFAGVVDAYGASAGSRGVNVDPGGAANTLSSWVQITSATVRAHQSLAVSLNVGDFVLAAGISWLVDIGIGGAGSEVVLIPSIYLGASATTDMANGGMEMFDIQIPAGVRLSARAQCSSATDNDRDLYVNLYGNS